jgi:hypothetical protein
MNTVGEERRDLSLQKIQMLTSKKWGRMVEPRSRRDVGGTILVASGRDSGALLRVRRDSSHSTVRYGISFFVQVFVYGMLPSEVDNISTRTDLKAHSRSPPSRASRAGRAGPHPDGRSTIEGSSSLYYIHQGL